MAVAGYPITLRRQCLLEPADRRQPRRGVVCLRRRHRAGIRPGHQALLGQTRPGKQRPRIDLALRRDVAVADDGARFQAMTRHDVLEQYHQRIDLRLRVGIPEPPSVRALLVALIDQLDADRGGVQPGTPVPFALPGMPGAAILVHQAVDGRRRLTDQVVAAHIAPAEQLQRARQVGGGVMQHDELDAAVVADRAVAGVDAWAAGTAGQQQKQEGSGEQFHRDDLCVDGANDADGQEPDMRWRSMPERRGS